MNAAESRATRSFLLQTHPTLLGQGLLLYGLGAAIARYLGFSVRPWPYLGGQAIVLALQVGAHYLEGFYAEPSRAAGANEGSTEEQEAPTGPVPANWSLYAAVGTYGFAAIATSVLLASGELGAVGGVLLAGGAVAGVAFSVPPLRLKRSGYGELLAAVCISVLIPTFAFVLQTDQVHRLLFMTTAPLACFTFAALLVEQLTTYSRDERRGRGGLMLRLGWQTGMRAHDTALGVGFAVQVALLFLDFPRRVALGGLLGVPLAAALIWYLSRIRGGAPARWTALRLGSRGLIGLMTYLSLSGYLLS